ncbi:MAG: DUF1830 domain-containing protein [Cyanobacteria bacterium P01_G01_bin.38]
MTYLLSLLRSELPSTVGLPLEKEFNSLCYYANDTKFAQNIRMIAEHECVFDHLVFSRERILFEAPSRAYIQVSTFLLDSVKTNELECQWLRIAEKRDSENDVDDRLSSIKSTLERSETSNTFCGEAYRSQSKSTK